MQYKVNTRLMLQTFYMYKLCRIHLGTNRELKWGLFYNNSFFSVPTELLYREYTVFVYFKQTASNEATVFFYEILL